MRWLWRFYAKPNSLLTEFLRDTIISPWIMRPRTLLISSNFLHFFSGTFFSFGAFMQASLRTLPDQSITWRWNVTGKFSSKSAYHVLINPRIKSSDTRFIWKNKSPLKVKIFTWALLKDKVPTWESLLNKEIQVPSGCTLCHSVFVETSGHLFINCPCSKIILTAMAPHAAPKDGVEDF